MSNIGQFSLAGRRYWRQTLNRMVATQSYPRFAFEARGKKYEFDNREDYQRAFSNYLVVDSRREAAGGYITEEMLLDSDTQEQYDLFREQQKLKIEDREGDACTCAGCEK